MTKYDVSLNEMDKTVVFGRGMDSSTRSQHDDIPFLSKSFYNSSGHAPGDILPFYIICQDNNRKKHSFHLFIGGLEDAPALQACVLPAGSWASIVVRPRFGRLWGGVVDSAKLWFYDKWLPKSPWVSNNIDYEYHTAATTGDNPMAAIYFALRKKEGAELLR